MKKIFALILAFALTALLPAFAENTATPAESEVYNVGGIVTEVNDVYFMLDNIELGELQVNYDENTVFPESLPFAAGQFAIVTYNGQMTRSLPAQIYAMNVVVSRIEGTVTGINEEEGYITIETAVEPEIIVYLNETDSAVNYTAGDKVLVYNSGAMTMSLPPQVGAEVIMKLYDIEGTVTEIGEETLTIETADEQTIIVNIAADTFVAGPIENGTTVIVTYNGMMTRSLPAQINALNVVAHTPVQPR